MIFIWVSSLKQRGYDVISTGESISAVERLVEEAGGIVAAKATILAEGDAAKRDDIIFLEELPLFPL